MLADMTLNVIDTFNILYLWVVLTNRDKNKFKFILSVVMISTLITAADQLNQNFIITYIIDIFIIMIVYRKEFKNAMFGLLLVLLIDMLLQLILDLVVSKFIYDYTAEGFIIELIISFVVIIFSKVSWINKKFNVEHINNNVLIYFIFTSSIYAVILKFIWDCDYTIIYNNLFIVSVILTILIISQVFTYLYVLKVIKEKEALKISNEYNEVINEIIQEIKQRQHDFVNYKNTITGIMEIEDNNNVKQAIANYMKSENIYDNKINELIYIDNVVIKSIIYRNICRAKKHDVKFEYKIENNVLDKTLSYNEISNLLNNMLNNAFDEVLKNECHEKNIEVKLFCENKTSHLIVKNQIANADDINLNEMFIRGYSTKGAAGTRGYGLYNVQQIVNHHKGHIKLNMELNEIIFNVYFNNSSG